MPIMMQRDAVLHMAMAMVERCAQCARRGPHGEWVLLLDEPRHDHRPGSDPSKGTALGAEFLSELAAAAKATLPQMTEVQPDPMIEWNARPTDQAWVDNCDALAKAVARTLNAFIVLVAVQELGKMALCTGGDDAPGAELDKAREMAKDMPRFLMLLAEITERMGEKSTSAVTQ